MKQRQIVVGILMVLVGATVVIKVFTEKANLTHYIDPATPSTHHPFDIMMSANFVPTKNPSGFYARLSSESDMENAVQAAQQEEGTAYATISSWLKLPADSQLQACADQMHVMKQTALRKLSDMADTNFGPITSLQDVITKVWAYGDKEAQCQVFVRSNGGVVGSQPSAINTPPSPVAASVVPNVESNLPVPRQPSISSNSPPNSDLQTTYETTLGRILDGESMADFSQHDEDTLKAILVHPRTEKDWKYLASMQKDYDDLSEECDSGMCPILQSVFADAEKQIDMEGLKPPPGVAYKLHDYE
jgi:hypothetical protein